MNNKSLFGPHRNSKKTNSEMSEDIADMTEEFLKGSGIREVPQGMSADNEKTFKEYHSDAANVTKQRKADRKKKAKTQQWKQRGMET